MVYSPGENTGKGLEEVKLQKASKQIVENVILQAVQQISQEGKKEENNQQRSGGQTLASRRLQKNHEQK